MLNRSNWKIIIFPVLLLIILGMVVWTIFDYGRYRAGFDIDEVVKREKQHQVTIERLGNQVADYRTRLSQLESAKKVDEYANLAVKESLAEMETENQVLIEELQFYRRIVSPSKGRQGMHIHDFHLTQTLDGGYSYRLTLVHIQGPNKHHRSSDGNVQMSVVGEQAGIIKKLSLANISAAKKSRIKYQVRYFARYEGVIKLPDNFKPSSIEIKVVPRQKNIKGDIRKIKWPIVAS